MPLLFRKLLDRLQMSWMEQNKWQWLQYLARRVGAKHGQLSNDAAQKWCHFYGQNCRGALCMAWRWRGAKSLARRHRVAQWFRHRFVHHPRGHCYVLEPAPTTDKPKRGRVAQAVRDFASAVGFIGLAMLLWWSIADWDDVAAGDPFTTDSFPAIIGAVLCLIAAYLWSDAGEDLMRVHNRELLERAVAHSPSCRGQI
jgi:hypothetical protein